MTLPSLPTDSSGDERPRQSRVGRLIPWLVVLSLGFLFLPLYLLAMTIDENNTEVQAEISTLQAELERGPLPSANEQELQDALSTALERISAIQPVRSQLENNRIDWPAVAASLSNYHDDYMVVLGLSQTGRQLTLSGRAWNEQTVLDYAGRLEKSGYFSRVSVQSLSANVVPTPTPPRGTPTAAAEPLSTTVAPTATPGRIKYVEFVVVVELKAAPQ
ncbi:MAG: PilN domain-containing protein [Chloroflexota bacterium]